MLPPTPVLSGRLARVRCLVRLISRFWAMRLTTPETRMYPLFFRCGRTDIEALLTEPQLSMRRVWILASLVPFSQRDKLPRFQIPLLRGSSPKRCSVTRQHNHLCCPVEIALVAHNVSRIYWLLPKKPVGKFPLLPISLKDFSPRRVLQVVLKCGGDIVLNPRSALPIAEGKINYDFRTPKDISTTSTHPHCCFSPRL